MAYQQQSYLKRLFKTSILGEAYLIVFVSLLFAFSLFADVLWVAELFVNFQVQYILLLVLLGLISMIATQNWKMTALAFAVAGYASFLVLPLIGAISGVDRAEVSVFDKPLKIVQYNVLNNGRDNKEIVELLSDLSSQSLDVAVLQEASPNLRASLSFLKGVFPYHYDKSSKGSLGTLILSRYEILHPKLLPSGGKHGGYLLHFSIKKEPFEEPVQIYTLHTIPPVSQTHINARDFDLAFTAKTIAADTSKNKVLVGDLNLTPYSPKFATLLQQSGLNYQNTSPFTIPEGTWPSVFMLPFLQVPIDHILVSEGLIVDTRRASHSAGSNHHPLIGAITAQK